MVKAPSSHAFSSLLAATAIALSLSFGMTAGSAQQPVKPEGVPPDEKVAGVEFAPRGQRLAREIQYSDWRKTCFKTPGTNMVCRTSIAGTFETGQSAVRIDLIEREGDKAARLQLFLPVGLYLPAGVKVTVDQANNYRIPYVWCLTNTCIAADVADPALLKGMDQRLKHETGMPIHVAENPLSCVAIGSGKCLEEFEVLKRVLISSNRG